MDGMTLLRRARDAGLAVLAEGDKLVIRGPRRAEPVARLVIEHKPAVMAALTPPFPKEWVALFAQRAAEWELGGRPRAEAERVAWAEVQSRWHLQHGERVTRDICAGCRRPIGAAPVLDLIGRNPSAISARVAAARQRSPCLIRQAFPLSR
jgi:hypothetical protein